MAFEGIDEFGGNIFEDDELADMQALVHQTAIDHGWWEGVTVGIIPEKLALIHSEVSEALEEYRKGDHPLVETYFVGPDRKPEGFGVELADAIIRILDLAGYLGINMAEAVALKHNYNITRSYRHGGKTC